MVFFATHYIFILAPAYGVDSLRFQWDLMAGSLIPPSFLLTLFLSKKFRLNPILAIPSMATSFSALLFLVNKDFYTQVDHMWVYAQIVSTIYASYLASIRCNLIIFGINLVLPLTAAYFYPHLEPLALLERQAIVHLASIVSIYFSFKNTINYKSMLTKFKKADMIRYASELGTYHWNLKTDFVEIDNRWLEIVGYKKDEISPESKSLNSLIHPEDVKRVMKARLNYISGKIDKYEIKFRKKHKSGHWVPILSKGKIIKFDDDGSPLIFSGTNMDFSDLQEVQEKYNKLNNLTNSIQSVAKIGGWELDIKTLKTTWTNETYHIHELPIGTPTDKIDGIKFYAEHEQDRISNYIDDCIKSGNEFNDEFEFITHKNNRRWVRVVGTPVSDTNGHISTLRGTFQDITEEKELKASLEDEKIKSLQASKLATLGEMAAGVAHEINNPLAIISGNAQLLTRFINDPERIEASAKKIELNVKRIAKVVGGLKKFSRSSETIDKGTHSISEIIDECISFTETKAAKNNIAILFSGGEDINIFCDNLQIEQIIVNLIGNAIDANSKTDDSWIEIFTMKNNKYLEIIIQDSGNGIEDEQIEKLFNPFFTTKAVGKGTGLGLSISKGIAKDHDGDLEYRILDGHTAFILSIPLTNENKDAA